MKTPCIAAAFLFALLSSPGVKAACPSPASDQTIQVPGHPFAAEPSPDNCHLFVSLMPGNGKGTLAVLDNQGGIFRVARVIKMPRGSGGGLTLDHKGSVLAVAAEDAVVFFDVTKLTTPDQDAVTGIVPESGNGVIYTQFSRDDAILFVSEERNASLGVINVSAALQGAGGKALSGRIPVGRAPVGLTLSADGNHLFSTSEVASTSQECKGEQDGAPRHGKGAVYAIDIAKAVSEPRKAVTGVILAGCNPVRVIASPDGHALWVSQRGDGRIMGFDAGLLAQGAPGRALTIEIGNSPVGLALRPDGKQLWAANSDRFGKQGGSLALIEMISPTEIKIGQSIKVGQFPRDLRFLPDGRTLVVALFGDDAVLLHPT